MFAFLLLQALLLTFSDPGRHEVGAGYRIERGADLLGDGLG